MYVCICFKNFVKFILKYTYKFIWEPMLASDASRYLSFRVFNLAKLLYHAPPAGLLIKDF